MLLKENILTKKLFFVMYHTCYDPYSKIILLFPYPFLSNIEIHLNQEFVKDI